MSEHLRSYGVLVTGHCKRQCLETNERFFVTSYVLTGTFINFILLEVQTIHMVSNIYSYNMPSLN